MFPLLEEPSGCPACGGDRLRSLHVYRNKAARTTPEPYLAMLGCQRCGLVHSHPLPTDEQLATYYGSPDAGWEARDGGDDFAAGGELNAKLERKREKYGRERDLLAAWLPQDEPRRALDFGAGVGAWLDVLQDAGWETWGVEPGPAQRELAGRRHRMIDAPGPDDHFDLVVVNHVLEHLRAPLPVLRQLAAAVRPGGLLFVSVPDLGRLGEHGKLKYVASDVHVCTYTASAMACVLGLAGFRVLARFDDAEWDALGALEPARLKVLAARAGEPVEPVGTPLDEAITAMRAHARRQAAPSDMRPIAAPASRGTGVVQALRERLRR